MLVTPNGCLPPSSTTRLNKKYLAYTHGIQIGYRTIRYESLIKPSLISEMTPRVLQQKRGIG